MKDLKNKYLINCLIFARLRDNICSIRGRVPFLQKAQKRLIFDRKGAKKEMFLMKRKIVIALLLVFTIILTGMLFACNDACTEHVDADGNLVCDNCGADLSTDQDSGDDNGDDADDDNGDDPVGKVTYTVTIKSMAGRPVKATAYIMNASTDDLKAYIATDETTGSGSKEVEEGSYYIEIGSLPEGYVAEAKYYFQKSISGGYFANIVLNTQVVTGSHKNYSLGDVMKDFTVSTVGGGTFTLSEALEEKDGVLLNFFYTTCSPCISEFPYLNEAAGMYSEDIAVICVDTNGDTFTQVETFYQTTDGGPLTNLQMGIYDPSLFAAFGTAGYPTSVMIDRYGVICLIEVGGLPYLYPFTAMFSYFSADNYTQQLFTSIEELTPKQKPAELGFVQPDNSVVLPIMNGANMSNDVVYYPETEADDADNYWPFYVGEKDGQSCMVSTNNQTINEREDNYNTIAVMKVDVTLQAGQALSLDYFCSSESGADNFYISVDGEVIYTISGEGTEWEKCYPFVATSDGTYEISFIYYKDASTDVGDDCVYIKNLNIVSASAIDKATYIPRNAVSNPTEYNDGYQNHATVVYNSTDGYYHVGTENGPLLLANLMNYVIDDHTADKTSLYLYAMENGLKINNVDKYAEFVRFCSYSSNSDLNGYCTVNEELKTYLVALNKLYKGGVMDESENGWLRFCRYYDAYGTSTQLDDPIAGLAPFSAYEIVINDTKGVDVYPNAVTYTKVMIPRGKLFSFSPETSGVYRIVSTGSDRKDAWIYDADAFYAREPLYEADHYERMSDTNCDGAYTQMEYGFENVCMNYYFEAGKEYFIDVAYTYPNATGTINFKIERVGDTYTHFRYVSPAFFTYYIDPVTGEEIYDLIAGGATPVLNEEDGYYYIGSSKVYVDISLQIITEFINKSIETAVKDGDFNFTQNEELDADKRNDYTAKMQEYISTKMIVSDGVYGSEASLSAGCIAVNEEMAEILQCFVDAYSFKGVPNAWTKLCYYFEYLGPESEA